MPLQIEQTLPLEQGALAQFLLSIFDANPDAPFVDPELMRWKYFEPCADWNGSRSIVLKQRGQIVAHGGIFPVAFLTQEKEVAGIHLIDWAASPSVPGAGVLLLGRYHRLPTFSWLLGDRSRHGRSCRRLVSSSARICRSTHGSFALGRSFVLVHSRAGRHPFDSSGMSSGVWLRRHPYPRNGPRLKFLGTRRVRAPYSAE